jgi:positive regulator of sigma E activity
MILIFIAIFLLKHFNELNKTQQATVLFFWISIAMTLYFSIFTNIEIMNKYFLNNCVLLYPLLGIFLHKIGDQLVKAEKNLIFIFMILIIIVSQYNVVFKGFIENNQNMKEIAIVKYLQKNHYYFGYATFWNANNLSVLSNGKIEIANFDSALDGRPYLWLTPSRYYSNGYYQGKTFLLLTKDEYSATSKNVIKGENKIIDKYGYIIIEYNKNKFNQ